MNELPNMGDSTRQGITTQRSRHLDRKQEEVNFNDKMWSLCAGLKTFCAKVVVWKQRPLPEYVLEGVEL